MKKYLYLILILCTYCNCYSASISESDHRTGYIISHFKLKEDIQPDDLHEAMIKYQGTVVELHHNVLLTVLHTIWVVGKSKADREHLDYYSPLAFKIEYVDVDCKL